MKRIVSLVLAASFVFASVFSVSAASYVQNGTVKTTTFISYKDLNRLTEVATTEKGKQCRIVNAQKYNGSDTTWIVRLSFAGETADYAITCFPYGRDPKTQEITTLPFKSKEEGNAWACNGQKTSWFYFGLFDDVMHNSCGFGIAERIKRWPEWNDLNFSGKTTRGVYYTGSYAEGSSEAFIENHIK